jgi:hypothetical protein
MKHKPRSLVAVVFWLLVFLLSSLDFDSLDGRGDDALLGSKTFFLSFAYLKARAYSHASGGFTSLGVFLKSVVSLQDSSLYRSIRSRKILLQRERGEKVISSVSARRKKHCVIAKKCGAKQAKRGEFRGIFFFSPIPGTERSLCVFRALSSLAARAQRDHKMCHRADDQHQFQSPDRSTASAEEIQQQKKAQEEIQNLYSQNGRQNSLTILSLLPSSFALLLGCPSTLK